MKSIASRVLLIMCVLYSLSGCSSGSAIDVPCCGSSSGASTGSIFLTANEYSKNAKHGDLIIFPLTIRHDIQGITTIKVTAAPSSGNRWKFALCYETECFISTGNDTIQKDIELSPNKDMEFEVKIFIPREGTVGDSSTVGMAIWSPTTPQVISNATFTATVR